MEAQEEQFTRRMLHRASLKKDDDQAANFASLRRRLSILKAIEDSELQDGRITNSVAKKTTKEVQKSQKEFKSQFVKNRTGAVKKNHMSNTNSWNRVHTPFIEPIQSSPVKSQESEEKLTRDQYGHQRNSKLFEPKKQVSLIKETRTQERRPIQFEESCLLQSTIDSNKVPIQEMMPNFLEHMENNEGTNSPSTVAAWESTLGNCINTYSAKIEYGISKISDKKETYSTDHSSNNAASNSYYPQKSDSGDFIIRQCDLASPISDLTFLKRDPPLPKGDFKFLKTDLHFPRPYRPAEAKTFKPQLNGSYSSYVTEASTNEMSLSSYMQDVKDYEWRNPSEIFDDNNEEAITPQLLTVEYKTIAGPENVIEFETIDPDSNIKECSPQYQTCNLTNVEQTEETATESGSLFSLSSAIQTLDEEIENLQLKPEAETLAKVMETPKKLFPLVDIEKPSGYTPRKLFQKESANEEKEITTPENLEKIGANESGLGEVKSNFLSRHANILRFKTPKSWRPKPNLESTRKASNFDLTKKTISPSQIESTISSINPNTPTSPETEGQKSPSILENTIPFEVEQFLEDALGEELYNSSITYAQSDMRDRTNSNLNASELMSEDITPPRQKQVPKTPKSEPSRHSTLNRTITAYKSMSQRIKKKFRPSLKETVKQTWNAHLPLNVRLDERLQRLLQEVNIQQTLIYQASKALDFCRTMKEFTDSPEQVESNRLILVASLRKQALFQEIRSLATNTTIKSKIESAVSDRADITIKDISLSLKEGVLRRERQSEDVVEWFVVVISQGLTVWATHATTCPMNSPRMYFPGGLSIPKMSPDFKINLKVYSLKLHKVTFNHEEKYHIQKQEKHKVCPSPTKLLKRTEGPLSPKSHEVKFSGFRDSSFVLMGVVDFILHDLSLYSPWPLRAVPKDSILHGTVDLSLTCKLHLSVAHAGFLTHGDEAGGFAVWNRRWCVLEGHTLMFWNYPREEEIKAPLLMIDLMDCVSNQVNTIDRTRCAKPRTFVIETSRHRNATDRDSIVLECRPACTIIRHLLQCDTTHDLIEWMTKLNRILSALREWNVIGTVPQPRESDL
ncbi:uncharacterized protein LOC117172390 [Belonocnema kinseyi]|uniref:uncharacterized protein LOC117172390 n=1 Tax=Belonocnema kinseyi TaxID=2817044 RepID=UPI00143D71F6|nr:uncharacterized protein LOC117172390 [Belonocnema kinseyi]